MVKGKGSRQTDHRHQAGDRTENVEGFEDKTRHANKSEEGDVQLFDCFNRLQTDWVSRTTQRKPMWQVEVSMPWAMRAEGR